jgi:hypothetical protein
MQRCQDRHWLQAFQDETLEFVGIYSMSGTAAPVRTWVHYADGHRGFCEGSSTEVQAATESVAVLPVRSGEALPHANPFRLTGILTTGGVPCSW